MKKSKVVLPVLIVVLLALRTPLRGDPEDFTIWKGVVSHIAETQLAWQTLQHYDDHLIAVSYLRDDAAAELHQSQIEILTVQAGEATLVVGGAILKPASVGPYEIRGTSIRGGSETQIRQGDIVQIRANVPHQLKAATGKCLIYTTIRMDSR